MPIKINVSCEHFLILPNNVQLRRKTSSSLTLELTEPVRLAVMFTGQDCCVEEDEDDNEPVEGLRFDCLATRSPCSPVDPAYMRLSHQSHT